MQGNKKGIYLSSGIGPLGSRHGGASGAPFAQDTDLVLILKKVNKKSN